MLILIFKFISVPALLMLTNYIQHRWGQKVAGFVACMPLTSGPISLFLAIEQGTAYAQSSAFGTLKGMLAFSFFMISFILCAGKYKWPVCALVGFLIWGGTILLLHEIVAPDWAYCLMGWLSLILNMIFVALYPHTAPVISKLSKWGLIARALAGAAFVIFVTFLAYTLDSSYSGMLAVFPIVWSTLSSFTLAHSGRPAVIQLLRGGNTGVVGLLCFFMLIGWAPASFAQHTALLYITAVITAVIFGYCSSLIFNWFERRRVAA